MSCIGFWVWSTGPTRKKGRERRKKGRRERRGREGRREGKKEGKRREKLMHAHKRLVS